MEGKERIVARIIGTREEVDIAPFLQVEIDRIAGHLIVGVIGFTNPSGAGGRQIVDANVGVEEVEAINIGTVGRENGMETFTRFLIFLKAKRRIIGFGAISTRKRRTSGIARIVAIGNADESARTFRASNDFEVAAIAIVRAAIKGDAEIAHVSV